MPRFTPSFLDELKSRLRPSDVVGRSVKLKKQGNEWAGLSPFTKEKTPSFFVNDQKGFFHCFSSGKHGDIIGFLQETQNLTFVEAVTILAADAGMELPKDDPQAAKREEANRGLLEACAAATVFFQQMLGRQEGAKARHYLQGREVTSAQVREFSIGYAPGDRHALKNYLVNKGFHEDVLAEAGLLIKPDDGGQSYDKFRDRVMFPILNPRGQPIAFGGRALNPDARAKYMNSPETPLFHKGSVLYRFGEARKAAAQDKAPIIVCEGYMDVVALWGAGITNAVAPLGTALTENQLAMLWRISDEPILCFDGDGAGVRAAYRSTERALPMLKPGKSLNFAFLPEGQDPDDLLRAKGRKALDSVLENREALIDVVWRRESQEHDLTTPERRAAFKAGLRALVKTIADRDVRDFYGKDLAQRLDQLYGAPASYDRGNGRAGGPQNKQWSQNGSGRAAGNYNNNWGGGQKGSRFGGRARWSPPARISPELRQLRLSKTGTSEHSPFRREATLVLALFWHPDLIERREPDILALGLSDSGLARLLADILFLLAADDTLDSDGLQRHLSNKASGKLMEQLINDRALNSQHFLQAEAQRDEVDWGFDNALAHHTFETHLKEELARAASNIFDDEVSDSLIAQAGPDSEGDTPPDSSESNPLPSSSDSPGDDTAWKAMGAAREEVINRNRSRLPDDASQQGHSSRLATALERMKASVKENGRKR